MDAPQAGAETRGVSPVLIRMPRELARATQAAARRAGVNRTAWVNRVLAAAVADPPAADSDTTRGQAAAS